MSTKPTRIIKDKTEIQEIRELLEWSRFNFSKIIGKSSCMIKLYETGKARIPSEVLDRARSWKEFYLYMKQKETNN